MKKLLVNGEEFEAEQIVQNHDSIVGYNGQTEVFAFRGISDFSQFKLHDELDNDITIDFHKERKINALNNGYKTDLTSGFTSNGIRFKYAEIDQLNFTKRTNAIALGISEQVFYFGTADGVIKFTIDEFKQAAKDAEIHEMTVYGKLDSLRNQVYSATTTEEVEAVTWQ
ncbi:DUF4376 domain-containing protein [Schinkia azotoformans]|uniref:DUF4376 domain-containing protein n=1 Tax=Schinkia azotoformans TaxID=1454 RepID=UPI002DBB5A8C|nr:hypothetical protein [Schinkia azotoformans]MEC1744101.1 hypothetical protein [Schinkia azotoformans]